MATLALAAGMATAGIAIAGTARAATHNQASAGEPGIVAVTSSGALVVLNPATGATTRTLVHGGVLGDELAASPSGKTVYFATTRCEIDSVPAAGGKTRQITSGSLPALNPEGTELAFAREPSGGYANQDQGCYKGGTPEAKDFSVVVLTLATGTQRSFPSPPGVPAALPFPITHLSWGPGGRQLAVSIGTVQDNSGQGLTLIDPATSRYYIPATYDTTGAGTVWVTSGPYADDSVYVQGAFLPDGNLFVDRNCCAGVPPEHPYSNLFWIVTTSGHLVAQVAPASGSKLYSSLGADQSGHWLMYLSTSYNATLTTLLPGKLFISHNGAAGVLLTTGLAAAAWL
jgi:hypothetical protein